MTRERAWTYIDLMARFSIGPRGLAIDPARARRPPITPRTRYSLFSPSPPNLPWSDAAVMKKAGLQSPRTRTRLEMYVVGFLNDESLNARLPREAELLARIIALLNT